jgi:hypothetical protein
MAVEGDAAELDRVLSGQNIRLPNRMDDEISQAELSLEQIKSMNDDKQWGVEIPAVEIPPKGWFVETSMRILAGDDEQLYQALIRL